MQNTDRQRFSILKTLQGHFTVNFLGKRSMNTSTTLPEKRVVISQTFNYLRFVG